MDIEFHYYITGIIANAAGFNQEEAKTIATASQFVDENDVKLEIQDRSNGGKYESYISQTMNILKPKSRLMRIYTVFHFVPGDPMYDGACRLDGKLHLLNTTPDNGIANQLMDEAFKASADTRLYRIGIATHAYADTWAHQNFVGWLDYFNNIGLDPKPDIGHANAEHHPDWVAHRWEDDRLVDVEVDNTERFLEAAEKVYNKYRDYLKGLRKKARMTWKDLHRELIKAIGVSFSGSENYYQEDRIARYGNLANWLDEFDETTWFDAAIEAEIRGFKDAEEGLASMLTFLRDKFYWRVDVDKENTDWFRFQESVKEHQAKAMDLLKPVFQRMGTDLHKV